MSTYTIITDGGDLESEETIGDYDDDEEAIRWTYYYLGFDRAEVASLYRGYRPEDEPPASELVIRIQAPAR